MGEEVLVTEMKTGQGVARVRGVGDPSEHLHDAH